MALVVLFFAVGLVSPSLAQSYKGEIRKERKKTDIKFRSEESSPLDVENVEGFKRLPYFSIKKKYKVRAKLELTPEEEVFEMPTTTERKPKYRQYALARFELNGKSHAVPIFQNQDLIKKEEFSDYLFLPFNDETNGFQTYGGGRFIDLRIPKEGNEIVIDFNKAYNPYCAYGDRWSCPIPPPESNIETEIKAGVKQLFKHPHH